MRYLLLFLAFAAFTSTASTAPVPKEILKKFPDYYPLLPGTEWEYKCGETEVTVKVEEYENKDGVRTGKLSTYVQGKEVATERIRVDSNGVYRTHINNTKIEPAILILKFGIKDETEWTTNCKVDSSTIDFTMKLVGEEEVEVPAGKFKAVKVAGTGKVAQTETQTTFVFAEGVGVIQLTYSISGNVSTLNLKKFTPGKEEKK